jgi:hypothetical protein
MKCVARPTHLLREHKELVDNRVEVGYVSSVGCHVAYLPSPQVEEIAMKRPVPKEISLAMMTTMMAGMLPSVAIEESASLSGLIVISEVSFCQGRGRQDG